MASKEIPVTEDVYERLEDRRRSGESVSDVLARLLGSADDDWRTHFGFLGDEESRELDEVIRNEPERN